MSIVFRCVECSESYEVEDGLVGKTIRCRECHGFNRVPCAAKKLEPPPAPARFAFQSYLFFAAGLVCVASGIGLWVVLTQQDDTSPSTPNKTPLVSAKTPPPSIQPRHKAPWQPQNLEKRREQDEWARQEEAAEAERQRQMEAAEQQRQAQLQSQLAMPQREMAVEDERLRRIEQEIALFSPQELQLAVAISRKFDQGGSVTSSEVKFMRAHWIVFDTPKVHEYLRKIAGQFGMEEVCDNLGIPAEQRTNYAVGALFHLVSIGKGYMGIRTLLAVSRSIKTVGLVELPSPYKRFVRENPRLFPDINP